MSKSSTPFSTAVENQDLITPPGSLDEFQYLRQPLRAPPGSALHSRQRLFSTLNLQAEIHPLIADNFLTYDEEEYDAFPHKGFVTSFVPGEAGLLGSTVNLTNTIVGAGTLAIPYALASAGLVLGPIMLLVMAILCALSANLLLHAGAAPSYKTLAKDAWGGKGSKLIEASLTLFTFGALVGFCVILGDLILPVINRVVPDSIGQIYTDPRLLIAILIVVIVFPLSLLRKMSSLRFTSVLALVAILYTVVALVYECVSTRPPGSDILEDVKLFPDSASMFVAFPVLALAFTFHMNLAPLVAELHDPSIKRVQLVSNASLSISSATYLLVGIAGYLRWGSGTAGNVLQNFTDPSVPLIIGNVLLSLSLCLSFPLIVYPCRMNLMSLLSTSPDSNVWHGLFTGLIVFGAYGVSIIPGVDLSLVFGLVGSTVGNILLFVFPGAVYLKLQKQAPIPRKVLSYALILLGSVLLLACTFATIYFRDSAQDSGGVTPIINATNATFTQVASFYYQGP